MDLESTDASTQQNPKQIDEEFTTTAYLNVQDNLKLPYEDSVILEEPTSSTGTLSSLTNLKKELSFIDQFFVEKQHEEEPGKTNVEAEVQSMVSVPIHQDTSSVPPMTTPPPPPPPPTGASGAPGTSGASGSSQLPLPPPPLSTRTSRFAQQHSSKALSSSKSAASAPQSMAWTTSETRYKSSGIYRTQELSHTDSMIQDDFIPNEYVHLSNDEDSRNDHLPKADSRKDWWKPLPEEERPTNPEPAWTIPSSNVSDVENNWATALVSAYETPIENSLLAKTEDIDKFPKLVLPTSLDGGASQDAHLTGRIQKKIKSESMPTDHFLLVVLRVIPALSIFKMKATSCPDFGRELLMPEQIWIDGMYTYDISAKYGISHWWFNRQKFYINRHDSPSHRKEVRSHMRILSVVRIKAYSRYGYDYLSKIVLRRADLQEHTIAEKDFKNLYPSDFEELNLLLLQGHLDHLPGSDKQMLSTAVKLWTQNLVIRQPVEDFQLVVFPVNNNERNIMRFNEIHKFSEGTLTRILEALAYRVKEFKIKQLNLDKYHGHSDTLHNPPKPLKIPQRILVSFLTEINTFLSSLSLQVRRY
nr:hypothetical protein [Tanacetum cinerariifolium]